MLRRAIIALICLTASASAAIDPAVAGIIEKHCVRCHNDKKDKGDFRIDDLAPDFTTEVIAQKWAQIMFRINIGEMPPEDEDPMTQDEIGKIVDWIATRTEEGRAARLAKRGPVEHHRLSRTEYANTVRDLLGVEYDVSAPGALNEDPMWHGYDRVGALLTLSPSHVDRYFKAADLVLSRAYPDTEPKAFKKRFDAIDIRYARYNRYKREQLVELGIADKVRATLWPKGDIAGLLPHWLPRNQQPGIYRARIQLSGLPGPDGTVPHLTIWDAKKKRALFDEDVIAPEDKPVILEFEAFLEMPLEIEIQNELPFPFPTDGNHTRNVLDHQDHGFFIHSKDASMLNPTAYKLFDDDGKPIHPLLLIDWIEWEGPITGSDDLAKRKSFLAETEEEKSVVDALKRFASRAWRRPVDDAELAPYLSLIKSEREAGESFKAAFRTAMTGILTSKNFYYLQEGSPHEKRSQLNDWEIASRLSYFLWSSTPDEALLEAAADGSLRDKDGLRAQFRRMIADPKAVRFTETFPRQWLQLHNVGKFPPDPKLYPQYDLWLEKSMVRETIGYFGEMFANDMPMRDFFISDWTIANPRLAKFYNLRPLEKSGFQKIALRPEDNRGGLLTQAAILMLTSDGTRHRPVHRGVWVSEAIFGRTPPPPPPNVDPIEPTPSDQPKATVRMQLEAHASNPACASCHRNIDPLGFAFENYNAIGLWRTEETTTGKGSNPPVDPSGVLSGNRPFSNPSEFKQLMAADLDRFAEAFAGQLATFATRRMTTFGDRSELQVIAKEASKDGYRLRSFVETFVLSDFFRKR